MFLAPLLVNLLLSLGASEAAPKTPVLVELFTSEGCSSCPAADALLARLLRSQPIPDVEIVPLALHVDSWDHQGWKDPFASRAFTERQLAYSTSLGVGRVHTPQIIVDGREALHASDEAGVTRVLHAAASRPRLALRVDARARGASVRLSIDLPAAPADAEPIDVSIALTEDDLSSVVGRGENGGRTLHHVAVVRKLESLGTLEREAFVADGQMSLDRSWKAGKMRAVAWLQGRRTRHVYGTTSAALVQ
jgi:hypothetical protein